MDNLQPVRLDQYTNSTVISPTQRDEYLTSAMSYFRKILAVVTAIIEAQKSSILKPFDHIGSGDTTYRLYVQPVMFLLSLAAFIWMTVKTRKDKCFKSYILTVTFLLSDTIGMFLPLPFHFALLPNAKKSVGLNFKFCEVFRVFVTFLPQALYYHSQWLKFVACLFECMSIYFPSKAIWFYRKRFLTSLLLTSLLVATALSSLMQYDVDLEKFSFYDANTKQVVRTCIMVPSDIYDVDSDMYNLIRIVAPMTIGIIIPLICMVVGSIILLTEISAKSTSIPKLETKSNMSTNQSHIRFVAATSSYYIFVLLPRLAFEILLVNEMSRGNVNSTWVISRFFFTSTVLHHITVPATVMIYKVTKRLHMLKEKQPETKDGDAQNA